jgi:D-serine dehydratase
MKKQVIIKMKKNEKIGREKENEKKEKENKGREEKEKEDTKKDLKRFDPILKEIFSEATGTIY